MKRLILLSSFVSSALLPACGDDNHVHPDAAPDVDADVSDAAVDAASFVTPVPFSLAVSATGPDQIFSAAPGPGGTFYVAGFTAVMPASAKYVYVARVTSTGVLDVNFGSAGVFTSTLEFKGGTDEIEVVVQSDGKVVVAATIANDTNAADRDIGLFRVSANGGLDTTFGVIGTTPGYSRINLSTAYDASGLKATDAVRGLAVGPNDQLFLHAVSRDEVADAAASVDAEFTVARLSALGLLDTLAYGTAGKTQVNLNPTNDVAYVATPKTLAVLADGSVIASGYARSNTSNLTAQPVLYKLTPSGGRDSSFADGVFHTAVLTTQTEIYAFAIDGNKITTGGYGNESGGRNVWTPLRFDLALGTRSTTFGGTTNGVPLVDPSAGASGNNCRNAAALPGGKTMLIGSTGAGPTRDAALAILTESGALDTTYGAGIHTFQLGGDDQFWGVAVSGSNVLAAGWKGFASQSETANDNSYGLILPLQ